jgi:glyoxylase-like metal-dependent hydrolase (beta-lactamase superfamily II)
VLVATSVTGCEQERRVPYIPPTLHNWERPYRGRPGLELHVFRTGTLRVVNGLALGRGGQPRRRELPVLAWVLKHPRQGLIVIDTGLNTDLAKRPDGYLGGLLGMRMEPELGANEHLSAQMRAAGLDPARVRTVVLSNMRFYHTGEVEAFHEARVVVSKAEHSRAMERPAGYVLREFDDVERWEFLEVGRDGQPLG